MPKVYEFPLVPGPTVVSPENLAVFAQCYPSADLEDEFFEEYEQCVASLKKIVNTNHDIAIMSGEGMVALWGGLKSVLRPGDKVVSLCNGIYGDGIASMAANLGAVVHRVAGDHRCQQDPAAVIAAIEEHHPRLVTVVHCDTPTGLLNNLAGIGVAAHRHGGLLYVDFVSSVAGCAVHPTPDASEIDLGLIGSQKALSCVPDLAAVTVSARAWAVIEDVKYEGYDALLPFRDALAKKEFPYTHNWNAVAALRAAADQILAEGLATVFARHAQCAELCRAGVRRLGLRVFTEDAASSPTVTAVEVPAHIAWPALNAALRKRGVAVGGSYGQYAGKIFRLGHMGEQARAAIVEGALAQLADALAELGGENNKSIN